MPRELNVISQPGSSSGGDACTYMWACAICDENETCQKDKEGHSRWLVAKRMERIEYKVLVMSNKGGVGKSTCTTNLAVSLALKGWHVGICDMDIHGPNIPKMVGAEGQKLKISTSGGIIPYQAYNMKIASMSFLLQNSDDPIIWRDAYKYEFINQLLGGVEWQDLNFLLIDLPPGTGNESVTTIDLLGGVSGAVIITTPQEVALARFPQVRDLLQRQRSADYRHRRKYERIGMPSLPQASRCVPQRRWRSLGGGYGRSIPGQNSTGSRCGDAERCRRTICPLQFRFGHGSGLS